MFRHFFPAGLLGLALVTSAAPAFSAPAAPTPPPAGNLAIVHVFSGWRDAASFKRISEYFTGRENTGGEIVVRTQPGQRAGYYFLVRVANPDGAIAIKIKVQIDAANEAKTRLYAFTADLKRGANVLELGVTGADWPDPKANPVAWKLDFATTDDRPLASAESYVWEKPPATP